MAITFSCDISRTTGVAPLAVFVDCTGTTATGVTNPFHELYYEHSFGDPSAGLWQHGAQAGSASKNFATGACAAHVFETPGTYTITSRCWDGTDWASEQNTITVSDPDTVFSGTNTVCIGATGVPSAGECPAGATRVHQENWATILSTYANTGTGKRIMLKRGDTFTVASRGQILDDGPGMVCTFGSGAKPILNMTSGCTLCIPNAKTNTSNYAWGDWRLMDLQVDCNDLSGSHGPGIEDPAGGYVSFLCLRVDINNGVVGFGFGVEALNGTNNSQGRSHVADQLAIVDCTASQSILAGAAYGGYNSGNRVMFMGNNFDNHAPASSSFTHTTRWLFLNKAVIEHNDILHPGYNRHIIKMHAPYRDGAGVPDATRDAGTNYSSSIGDDGYTKYVIISNNWFESGSAAAWQVALSPQDSAEDERLHDIIYECNVAYGNAYTTAAVTVCAQKVTIRNNLMFGMTSNEHYLAVLRRDGGEPPGSDIWIYNNTMYTSFAVPSGQFVVVDINSALLSNITIRNNLAYAPNATSPVLYMDAGATGVTVDHNSSSAQITGTNPTFAGTTSAIGFRPSAGSYATTSGVSVFPVTQRDFYNGTDKTSSNYRMGAMVPKANVRCSGSK
jgi:hypothetical protein